MSYPSSSPLPGTERPSLFNEKLLDRQDILQLFHVSVRTLQNWRSKGLLPYSKIGNKIYYRQGDVEAMLNKARREGKAGEANR